MTTLSRTMARASKRCKKLMEQYQPVHELKTYPDEFQAVLDGLMTFQLRRNDRGFMVRDHLLLREWVPGQGPLQNAPGVPGYTGREVLLRMGYIMDAAQVDTIMIQAENKHPSLSLGYVIMSVSHVN